MTARKEAPQLKKQKIDTKTWVLIATCPVCDTMLNEDESYKIGWILHTPDDRWLSVRGHIQCVDNYRREQEDNHA